MFYYIIKMHIILFKQFPYYKSNIEFSFIIDSKNLLIQST